MDAHFLDYHMQYRRQQIQRDLRAIRLQASTRGQRSGRATRLINAPLWLIRAPLSFLRALILRRTKTAQAVASARRSPKLA